MSHQLQLYKQFITSKYTVQLQFTFLSISQSIDTSTNIKYKLKIFYNPLNSHVKKLLYTSNTMSVLNTLQFIPFFIFVYPVLISEKLPNDATGNLVFVLIRETKILEQIGSLSFLVTDLIQEKYSPSSLNFTSENSEGIDENVQINFTFNVTWKSSIEPFEKEYILYLCSKSKEEVEEEENKINQITTHLTSSNIPVTNRSRKIKKILHLTSPKKAYERQKDKLIIKENQKLENAIKNVKNLTVSHITDEPHKNYQ